MKEENDIKIANIIDIDIYVKCPYCGEEQETYYNSGELDICAFCNREFEIGDL